MASYLDARQVQGQWLLRIEDLDGPREPSGAARKIIEDLAALGFQWDGGVTYQSQRTEHYQLSLAAIKAHTFHCTCSRADQLGSIYDGRCRNNPFEISENATRKIATRVVAAQHVTWHDRNGTLTPSDLANDCGDFVLKRRDGLWAYQLAVVVDDGLQNITHVVRGLDLIESTARQLWLQKLLRLSHPHYWHVPLVLAADGEKLSKQNGAAALKLQTAQERVTELKKAWGYLSTAPLQASTVDQFWQETLRLFYRRPEALPPAWRSD